MLLAGRARMIRIGSILCASPNASAGTLSDKGTR